MADGDAVGAAGLSRYPRVRLQYDPHFIVTFTSIGYSYTVFKYFGKLALLHVNSRTIIKMQEFLDLYLIQYCI